MARPQGYSFEMDAKGVPRVPSGSLARNPADASAFNSDVQRWGRETNSMAKAEASTLWHGTGALARSLYPKFKKDYGQIDRVGFNLERHGVFVQKGVGRGYQMFGNTVKRFTKSPGTSLNRKPVDWFNGPLARNMYKLEKTVEHHAREAIALNTQSIFIR